MRNARVVACVCVCFLLPQVVSSQPQNLALESDQAAQLMAAGKYEQASRIYQNLVKALPENPGLAFDFGLALHMARREREAVAQLQKALALDPQNIPARLYLAYAYLSLGKPARALEPLERVMRADSSNVDAADSLAETLMALGRFREAAARFEAVVKARPVSASAWHGLGRSYQSLSQTSFEKLQKLSFGSAYWLALAADSNAKTGKYESAFYLYRQALKKMPGIPGLHAGVAAVYSQTGHADWAEIEQKKAAGPPNCVHSPFACSFLAGRYEDVLKNTSETTAALYWKCKAYDQLALRALKRLTELPSSPQLHELMAETHEAARDYALALQEWQEAYRLSGNDPQIGEKFAMALLQTKNYEGAKSLAGTILGRRPDSAAANYQMGYALLQLQQPSAAIPYLRKSVRLDPTALAAHQALGQAYVQTGQSSQAIVELKAALSLDQDGSVHYQLARAYRATGQPTLAQAALQKYRALDARSREEFQELKSELQITAPDGAGEP